MDFKEGTFKAKGVVGSEQLIDSTTQTPGLAIDLTIPELGGVMTTTFYITTASWPVVAERLRALGWKGQTTDDLADLSHIGDEEVNVRVWNDKYTDPKDGKSKANWKCEIMTRGGKVTFEKKLDKSTWLARIKSAVGNAGAGGGGGQPEGEPPPF